MFQALQCPSSGARQTAVAASGFQTQEQQQNGILQSQWNQRQFDGLLMMGIVMPETCCAVSVRQSNKFYD